MDSIEKKIVTPKGGYDINILNEHPYQIFNPLLKDLIKGLNYKGINYDVAQAAKCLAFDVPTAAAFHLHKVNEAVLQHYYKTFYENKLPDNPNLEVLLNNMNELDKQIQRGDPSIIACLREIKDLHRNPILHFEETGKHNLTSQQAIELFGIINSITSAMLTAIYDYQKKEISQKLK